VSGVLLVALLLARQASAQTVAADSPQWLKNRSYASGAGVRAGDFELHPGVAGEVGYDSNWLLRTDRTTCGTGSCENGPPLAPVIPALEFRITPSLYLSTLGPQRREGDILVQPSVAFRAAISATYREFIGLSSDSKGPNNDISAQRNLSVAADSRLTILPGRPVGGALFVSYAREIQPNMTTVDPNLSFNRDDIGAGAELALQPNSGTLDWRFVYQYRAVLFEEGSAAGFTNGTHEISTHGRWRFRPRTALVYDATMGFISYRNSDQAAVQGLVGSTPIRTSIGLNGLITDRFSLLAVAGWAASLYDTSAVAAQPQYDSFIARAELTWFLAGGPSFGSIQDIGLSLSSIVLGYGRDFQNSYLGNYYGSDRGYLRFNYFFASRALVNLEGGLGSIEYPNMYWLPTPASPSAVLRHASFTDLRADATLFAEYRVFQTLGINSTLRYTTNISNVHDMPAQQTPTGAGSNFFDMGWKRFEAFIGVRWFM
ncbi:MAG: hypothetical protein M3O46_14205, partial [Myxococcota bacterium]|nr:hypothetical protein [Myxococcota bacterium]